MDWIAFSIGLVGLYYNGQKRAICWLIFIGSSACWLLHWALAAPSVVEVELAAAVMSLVTIGVNWRNYRKWRREGPVQGPSRANGDRLGRRTPRSRRARLASPAWTRHTGAQPSGS